MFAEQGAAVYTLGVGALFVERLARCLEAREVEYVIDIRSPPHGFHRPELFPEPLEAFLGARQTRYLNLAEDLGDRPRDVSLLGAKGQIDYRRYRSRPGAARGLERIMRAWEMGCRVCVLGRHPDPVQSHRARLVGHALFERGVQVRHLVTMGDRLMTHEELLRLVWRVRQSIHRAHHARR